MSQVKAGDRHVRRQASAADGGLGAEPCGKPDALWGYAIADLDDLAARVVRNNMHWWPAGDRRDQHDVAWCGVAEHLCAVTACPSSRDLLEAGRRALAREVRDAVRHHGARRDTRNDGSRFAVYWAWQAAAVPSPEGRVTEQVAVAQVMAALTPRQRDAFTALAVTGDYAAAARMAGIMPQTFRALIGRARSQFLLLWHEGEEPSRIWRQDRRVARRAASGPADVERRAAYAAQARERRKAARAA